MSAQDDGEYVPSDAGDEGVKEAASNAAEEAVQESAKSVTNLTSPSSTATFSANRKCSAVPVATARASNKKKKQQQKKKARKGASSRIKIK